MTSPDLQRTAVEVFGQTDAGQKRSENQDNFLIADLAGGADGFAVSGTSAAEASTTPLTVGPKGLVLLVADGMGGAAAGGTASRLAVSHIHERLVADSTDVDLRADAFALRLAGAVESANAYIHQCSLDEPQYRGMGTTATLAGVLGDIVYFVQVGDSRAYVIRAGAVVQVTRDQSVVQELVDAGTMTEEEAERSVHANKILQALGAAPSVRPVLTYHPLRSGDIVLLCSDGLTRVMRKHEIGQVVEEAADLRAACSRLIELSNERGAPDNVTVIAARFDGAALQPAAPGDVVARLSYELPRA